MTNWAWESLGIPTGEIWDVPLEKERAREVKKLENKGRRLIDFQLLKRFK